jgi:membrane fusion protein (multidrug efflux system)
MRIAPLTHAALLWLCLGASALAQTPQTGAPAAKAAEDRRITLPATVAPYQQVVLVTRLGGFVKSISVDAGDKVSKGQTLAIVEAPELLADRTQYQAEVAVAQTSYDRLKTAIEKAPDLVSAERVDTAKAQLQIAEARLSGVETRLAFGRITAPFSGVVTERKVDPGAFVAANSGVILTLMDFQRVRIQVRVPEKDAQSIKKGAAAVITSSQVQGLSIKGAVTRISFALDASSRMMLAEIELNNRDGALRPGMLVNVALTVPPSAPPAAGAAKP